MNCESISVAYMAYSSLVSRILAQEAPRTSSWPRVTASTAPSRVRLSLDSGGDSSSLVKVGTCRMASSGNLLVKTLSVLRITVVGRRAMCLSMKVMASCPLLRLRGEGDAVAAWSASGWWLDTLDPASCPTDLLEVVVDAVGSPSGPLARLFFLGGGRLGRVSRQPAIWDLMHR